jgi:inosine-uridine nucleoside N-ribohydrolase
MRVPTDQNSDIDIAQITSTNRDIDRSVSGVEYILNACRSLPGEISILILSPATTLATAVAAFPSLPNYVKR